MTQKAKKKQNSKNPIEPFFTKWQKKEKLKYLDFVSYFFNKLGFRSVEYTKMTVWDSGL